jgi:hypothetical protein
MNINELHLKISEEALGVWSVMTHHLLSSLSLAPNHRKKFGVIIIIQL